MRDLTPKPTPENHGHSGDSRVVEAVDAILRKLKRGHTVRLPGIGSLLPGAPPRFRSLKQNKPASLTAKGGARNAKP